MQPHTYEGHEFVSIVTELREGYYSVQLVVDGEAVAKRRLFRGYSEARTQALDWVEQKADAVITIFANPWSSYAN